MKQLVTLPLQSEDESSVCVLLSPRLHLPGAQLPGDSRVHQIDNNCP